jgi:uncharacterized membrane protein YeaQ/YmgE (transglycosylase-associated protein family)
MVAVARSSVTGDATSAPPRHRGATRGWAGNRRPAEGRIDSGMLVLGIILFGMLVGAAAQLVVGRSARGVDWGRAVVAGIVGSFIGGLLINLISGDGWALRPSGILGSLAGAIVVTLVWQWWRTRRTAPKR